MSFISHQLLPSFANALEPFNHFPTLPNRFPTLYSLPSIPNTSNNSQPS
ncbi:hypothetical protein [Nostoc sp.]